MFRMARKEGQLLVNLKTNYPDVAVDIGKIVLGEISKKKISNNQKRKRSELVKAVCALLNSGGGVVRMEIENKNYYFQEHSIGLDIEQSLRVLIDSAETGEYFTWMQQQSHFLLFVKNLKLWRSTGEKQKLMAREVLDFTDTTHVEFKNFSTRDVLKYIREILLNYVSAFANTQGGYLIFGVDDSSKVVGSHSEVEKEALAKTVADVIGLLRVYHFCRFQATVQFKSNILNVYDKEEHLHGYVCALRGKPFCWAVFHDIPRSWIVKGNTADRLSIKKWT
ncbi:LOW QUALITY PROTEIN: protein SLFN14-like [Apteryx rowi]|uniref:LOW QUALITY PROTEIN: protein SLFN14-like n=1 Tax=Apteryx rowi TaxID=308060 RepID=UPI000E1E1FB9|nr:LOW QUALITY PROTEIN: protein SLFN14-like [Apteryx rowi]